MPNPNDKFPCGSGKAYREKPIRIAADLGPANCLCRMTIAIGVTTDRLDYSMP